MLAEFTRVEPGLLRFRASRWGRPELVGSPGVSRLRFSLSHADGVAATAVGADVESLRNVGPDPLGLAQTICSPREWDALRKRPASVQAERLLFIWTLKEAIVKAMGLGFRYPLPRILIHRKGGGPPTAVFDPQDAGDVSLWRLSSLRVTPHHRAAVAALGAVADDVAVRFEEGWPYTAAWGFGA